MECSPRYRLFPTTEQRESLDWTRDIVRQVYNHAFHEFNKIPEDEGTLRQRVWQVRDDLPSLKQQWTDLKQVYSTVLQKAVERIRTNINNLGKLKAKGYDVGSLNWKSPREFRSVTYRQSGFELDKKSGPRDRSILRLKKVRGDTLNIPIRFHRDLPEHDAIKEVTVKKEPTGAWYASFCISTDEPEKPDVEAIDSEDTVGLDLGVLNFVHDSDDSTYLPSESDSNVSNARSPANNTSRPTGRNNAAESLRFTLGCRTRSAITSTNSRTST